MQRHPHVNRTHELSLLDQVLAPDADQTIFLIQAQSGYGKTLLLGEFQARIEARSYPLAVVDFNPGGMDPMGVLALCCQQWGNRHFPRFQAMRAQMAQPQVNVDVNRVAQFGRSNLEVTVSGDLNQRRLQAQQMTEVWLQDVEAWLGPDQVAVLVVDTYNLAGTAQRPATVDPELRTWVESYLLTELRSVPGLRLILAGQQIPDPNAVWERRCHRHELGPIPDPSEWMPLVHQLGGALSLEVVSSHCHVAQGHPFQIATRLSMLCTSWSVP